MACDSCSMKLGLWKRKRICCLCNHLFCSSCLTKEKGSASRKCKRCRVLFTVPLDRGAIMALRVRDLKWYLSTKSLSIQTCKEKSDLVDLIMQNAPRTSSSYYGFEGNDIRNSFPNGFRSSASTTPTRDYSQETYGSQSFSAGTSSSQSCPSTPRPNSESNLHHECSSLSQNLSDSLAVISVDDLESLDQIAQLSIRQLKLILIRNFVDYKGCCEKWELQERVQRLWKQKQDHKQQGIPTMTDENLCKICMEAPIDCVLLECGHMATCTTCGKQMHECPICRQYVIRAVHIFKA